MVRRFVAPRALRLAGGAPERAPRYAPGLADMRGSALGRHQLRPIYEVRGGAGYSPTSSRRRAVMHTFHLEGSLVDTLMVARWLTLALCTVNHSPVRSAAWLSL